MCAAAERTAVRPTLRHADGRHETPGTIGHGDREATEGRLLRSRRQTNAPTHYLLGYTTSHEGKFKSNCGIVMAMKEFVKLSVGKAAPARRRPLFF